MKNKSLKPHATLQKALGAVLFLSLMEIPLWRDAEATSGTLTLNAKDTGYRGIWYMNQPSGDEYVYKYSGGLGTYCADHQPFAVYCEQVEKTFFCYGGTTTDSNRHLLHAVSYYDHRTGMVPRPTILLDKKTDDAHPDFYAIWADGHARKPSESSLYFCDKEGNVRVLPREMAEDFAAPKLVEYKSNKPSE